MIRLKVSAGVKQEKRLEFLQTMHSLLEADARRVCCSTCLIVPDPHDPNLFNVTFEWKNDPDFEHCLDSEQFRVFLGAVRVLCEEPICFCNSLSEKWARIPGLHREFLRIESAIEKGRSQERN